MVFDSYDDLSRTKIEEHAKMNNRPLPEVVSPKVKEDFQKRMAPVYDEWVTDMAKKGLPGKEVLKDAREMVDKIESGQKPMYWSVDELPLAKQ
jgi:hypothetical protein